VAFLLHALVDDPMQRRPALPAGLFAAAAAISERKGSSPKL